MHVCAKNYPSNINYCIWNISRKLYLELIIARTLLAKKHRRFIYHERIKLDFYPKDQSFVSRKDTVNDRKVYNIQLQSATMYRECIASNLSSTSSQIWQISLCYMMDDGCRTTEANSPRAPSRVCSHFYARQIRSIFETLGFDQFLTDESRARGI